jgi:hypothetical protein
MAKGAKRSDASGLSGRSRRFRSLMARFCWQTFWCWWLPRAFETACGPLGLQDVSWFSAAQDHPAVVGQILDSGRLTAYSGLSYLNRFALENPGDTSWQSGCPTSIHCRAMGLASSGIYTSARPATHSATTGKLSPRKMKKLNRWRANSLTYTNQYFSGLP